MSVALVCPGQGAQRLGAVEELPAEARTAFERASGLLGRDLWTLCEQGPEEDLAAASWLQPLLVTWAVAELEAARPRTPELAGLSHVMGHSSGENSAMVLSGAVRFEDAVLFAHACGRNLEQACRLLPGGLLALAGGRREDAQAIATASGATLANHNAANQTVLGGTQPALDRAAALAAERGLEAVALRVAGAFHTELFQEADGANLPLIDALPIAEEFVPLIGNAAGQLIRDAGALRAELRGQYSRPIEWVAALDTAYRCGVRTFLTAGPGNAMSGLVRRFARQAPAPAAIVRLAPRARGD